MVQPVQLAFQQQIQTLKTQHEEFVANLTVQQTAAAAAVSQLAAAETDVKAVTTQPGEGREKHTRARTHPHKHTQHCVVYFRLHVDEAVGLSVSKTAL